MSIKLNIFVMKEITLQHIFKGLSAIAVKLEYMVIYNAHFNYKRFP